LKFGKLISVIIAEHFLGSGIPPSQARYGTEVNVVCDVPVRVELDLVGEVPVLYRPAEVVGLVESEVELE
jgi:hypothetical protein